MIGSSKKNRENYPSKCLWTQEKEARVKFKPGLGVNRPSNNWAQDFKPNLKNKFKLAGEEIIKVLNIWILLIHNE